MNVRKPAVAGAFYPAEKAKLLDAVNGNIANAKNIELPGKLRGLVVPHAGYVYSGPVAGYGYKLLAAHSKNVNHVILVGPSHYAAFEGACSAGFDLWETPLGKVKERKSFFPAIPQAHAPEHCLEVQLPFLQVALKKDFEITPLLCGDVDAGEVGKALERVIDERTLLVASSDLSHYLPYKEAVETDAIANKSVPALDIETFEERGDACGKTGILTLMHAAKKLGWNGLFLDYKNSGDTAGDKTRVVGYGCYAFYEK